jgi:large subunit ribosomal protein L6
VSRIGNLPIKIPENVEITVSNVSGKNVVTVKGPKGELSTPVKRAINVKIEDGVLTVARINEAKQTKSYHGLYRSLINNMVEGVTNGYSKDLEIVGIGYRAEQQGDKIVFSVGLSHKITFQPPVGITIKAIDQTNVRVEGFDKQLVGEVASKIRGFRPPEPYKGKGIRYKGEMVRKKSAKSAGK